MFGTHRNSDMTNINPERSERVHSHDINNDLVIRALNYHGQQLSSFMKERNMYQQLDVKNVDFHLYHQRSRELKMEDRGKRLLLHRFISQNSERLFTTDRGHVSQLSITLDNDQVEEHSALLPPFEAFTDIHEDDRCRHFFEAITPGDTIYCRVIQKSMSGLMLSVLCLDPITSKSRFIDDIKIRCFCPSAEMIPASDPRDPVRSYESGDIVRVVVLEVKVESQRLLSGMHSSSLKPELQNIVKLGLVLANDLPSTYSYTSQATERKIPFSVFLEKSVGFLNPTNVTHLASELGLDAKGDSLMGDLTGRYPPETYVTSLRKEQANKWAFKHVAQGIKYFKSGNNVEAFQCLNQALNIDSENVEGLVARGALYANNGGLDKAIEDFESALRINRHHKNAKKYMCETLIAVARNQEDENKVDEAIGTYQRILEIAPDHKEVQDSIYFLRGKPKDVPLRDDHFERNERNKPKLMLDDEKVGRERNTDRKKKKRRRRRSSGSSWSTSSSVESSDSRKVRNKKKAKDLSVSPFSSRSARPLSPFSAKMAPGVMNMPPDYQPDVSGHPSSNLPNASLPDVRAEINRIKSKNAEMDSKSMLPSTSSTMAVHPVIDLTRPPPGYKPHHYDKLDDYDDKVRKFLQETGFPDVEGLFQAKPKERNKNEEGERKSRCRSKEKRRSRSRSKSPNYRSLDRSFGIEKNLLYDDDFAKKLKDHLSNSEGKRKDVADTKEKRRSGSQFTEMDSSREFRLQSRSNHDSDNSGKRNEGYERTSSWQPERNQRFAKEKSEPDRPNIKSSTTNVFGLENELEDKKEKSRDSKKVPIGSGMWIPTGEDSILDGVKEAISKLEEKQRYGKNERHSDRRTGMESRNPRSKHSNSEIEERIVRNVSDSPPKKPTKKRSLSAERNDSRRSRNSRRSRSRSGRRRTHSRSRRRKSRSRSKDRIRSKNDRSKSRGRRSSSYSRRRSRSRNNRGRSRSHRNRCRSRSRRSRSISRSRRNRSKSRCRDQSRSRSLSRSHERRKDNKFDKTNTIQQEITGMREETRRLQSEREAIEREKAMLLAGPGGSSSSTAGQTRRH